MNTLNELANKYGTDKGDMHYERHNYTGIYEKYMEGRRNSLINLMEIGINDPRFPGASILMWMEYFKNGFYRGVDINLDEHVLDISRGSSRCFLYEADQKSSEQLSVVCMMNPSFDFVIDDGAHTYEAQINSFFTIFPSVRRGGVYFIEDCHVHDGWKTLELFRTLKSPAMDINSIDIYDNKLIAISKL